MPAVSYSTQLVLGASVPGAEHAKPLGLSLRGDQLGDERRVHAEAGRELAREALERVFPLRAKTAFQHRMEGIDAHGSCA
ncbi:MAG: hypothetical protein IPI67_16995 [Myxococcales bacterium]|nr:hypothetical protein [Myxococcales bacterium]